MVCPGPLWPQRPRKLLLFSAGVHRAAIPQAACGAESSARERAFVESHGESGGIIPEASRQYRSVWRSISRSAPTLRMLFRPAHQPSVQILAKRLYGTTSSSTMGGRQRSFWPLRAYRSVQTETKFAASCLDLADGSDRPK